MSQFPKPTKRGNSLTGWVTAHPRLWALLGGALVASWGMVSIGDLRAVIPMSLGSALLNFALWRPGGRGAKWAAGPGQREKE